MPLKDINIEVTRIEIAEVLGLTARHVQKLAADGTIPRTARGRYRLGEAVKAYVAHHRGLKSDPRELQLQRARLAKVQAESYEIKNALTRGELLPAEDVSAAVSRVASAVVVILESIPIRLKRANPSLTQLDLDIVQTEIAKARNECARMTT